MARIRSIKPEFPQSESMGRVSRDARLLFIQIWTICDDSGRTRAASRMLASLLFPYDDDAPKLIDGWLGELEREGCIVRYQVDDGTYLEVCNWLNHQKIDKPSRSKIPAFDESSRILANPRERSSLDQGSRIKDQGREATPDGAHSAGGKRKPATTMPDGVDPQVWADWLALRKAKRAPVTETVIREAEREAKKAGMTLEAFLRVWCSRGSQGLQADWLRPNERAGPGAQSRLSESPAASRPL